MLEFADGKYVDKWHSNRKLQFEWIVVDEDDTFDSGEITANWC